MYGFYREKLHVHHFWELKGYGFFITVHKNDFSLQFHRILKLKEQQKEIIIQGKAGVFMARLLRFANYERCMVKSKEKSYLDLWNE